MKIFRVQSAKFSRPLINLGLWSANFCKPIKSKKIQSDKFGRALTIFLADFSVHLAEIFFFLNYFWWNISPYCIYSPLPPLRGQPSAVRCRLGRLLDSNPGLQLHNLVSLPMSHHWSLPMSHHCSLLCWNIQWCFTGDRSIFLWVYTSTSSKI